MQTKPAKEFQFNAEVRFAEAHVLDSDLRSCRATPRLAVFGH
jgi:hypothetical protein